ncbi:putative BTB/POZ domain-containing protein KCTD7/14 [Monocercomonoides exilis]|uniref:putative BTB/POZ domain-containing protein KCTD7/14 n=1 Tax=Monocercomonoides exilis TaxID=2049356 RepID=UPI003559C95C|nr:putative BTB/POZ domain-containing protein KCTD7/14 [Monocercomonoides exilis]|eukprot:MONOS_140.1-p1 / transcript=MONOS_140.1 / gene=MONOS_140 / organism=Monocercomonoides_exilis_PA203 / gene_product=unspecified product / transcript_product=unspecified product / location=Mono_scaffold00002:284449-285793(-) / protein_length=329 / sequence_SO=supercontig / SO=protein_coding / is_pseudo=false
MDELFAKYQQELSEERKALQLKKMKFNDEYEKDKEMLFREQESFLEERQRFEEEESAFDEMVQTEEQRDEVILLNVGGKNFSTLRSTLTRYEDSMLSAMFSGRHHLGKDNDDRIFIDRDPDIFSMILEFLRTGIIPMPKNNEEEELLRREMDYFALGPPRIPFLERWNAKWKSDGLTLRDEGRTVEVIGEDRDHIVIMGDSKITHGSVTVTVQVTIPRPNRYSFGVLPDIPASFNKGFAYKSGVLGWGLHDHTSALGIYCQTQLVAPSTLGYVSGDLVTMTIDVDRGDLIYKVNGVKCAELLSSEVLKMGVYIAATLFNKGAIWKIVEF